MALLVVAVGGAGVAAALPGSSSLRGDASSSLAAANVGAGAALGEQSTTSAATPGRAIPPTTPATSTTASPATTRATPTSRPGTVPTAPTTLATLATRPGFVPTTVAPGQPAQTVPPPVNPPAWAFEGDGLSVRLRMTPIAPRVGDTVEFTIEAWTDLQGVTCCNVVLQFAGNTVFRRVPQIGPCPDPPRREERVRYRITEPTVSAIPGPFVTVRFSLTVATTFDPCAGLQQAARVAEFGVPVVVRLPGT